MGAARRRQLRGDVLRHQGGADRADPFAGVGAGAHGHRVNCVAPGVIKTDMLDALPPEVLPQLAQETPLGRLGTPEDIAAAVSFLADDRASFITGQVLTCDRGFIL